MRLAGPVKLDATPLQAAFSPGGQVAVGLGFVDPDRPSGASASVAVIPAAGRPVRTRGVPHTREVLDVAYLGGTLQILGGTSGGGLACCTQIQTLTLGSHGFSAARPLIRDLQGDSSGRLIASGSGSLAVFASSMGVWAARAGHDGRFGSAHQLTAGASSPESLLAATLHGGRSLVAFAQTPLVPGSQPAPPTVMVSRGSAAGLPPRPAAVARFATGTVIGPLALAPNPSSPVLGWTEDATDGSGDNSSAAVLANVGAPPLRTRTFAISGEVASGLTGAANGTGDELFAWESCDTVPVCHVLAVSRPPRGRFGTARTLGTIDAATEPAVAVGDHGAAVIAWVTGGRIYVSRRGSSSRHFSAPVRLAGPGPVTGLHVIAGPSGRMLAVWVAGTYRTTIWASELR